MFAERDLVAHFLHASSKSFNLLLPLSDGRLQSSDFAVFFQELIDQHRVRGLRAKI